eukprot:c52977_g1_i1.p1 GENE.c52977_g1_i1~~c52977_g1_i1.p1  ORF type:complete len:365 (-),score=51.93 c52977_g1_i1:185-1279(-)
MLRGAFLVALLPDFLLCQSSVNVVAYLPEWRYEGANWEEISRRVSHLILFSLEPTPDGGITALDRFPRSEIFEQARREASKFGARLMICFGGNGRSNGFSNMVRSTKSRERFVRNVIKLLNERNLDGVDYNWEYPGYRFDRGYLPEDQIKADYDGLLALAKETRQAMDSIRPNLALTLAYYPDGRQEELFHAREIWRYVDLMHMMTYDQQGAQHSSLDFARRAIATGIKSLPSRSLTVGLPFYGRHSQTGDWTTYEDLLQADKELDPAADSVNANRGGGTIGFNGVNTIRTKTKFAIENDLGGVMIWEVGQDCRLAPVSHGGTTHVMTCHHPEQSLLVAIESEIAHQGARINHLNPDESYKSEL